MTALTETQIERHVERAFDSLDNRLMMGWLTQAEYDKQAADIASWADRAYAARDDATAKIPGAVFTYPAGVTLS